MCARPGPPRRAASFWSYPPLSKRRRRGPPRDPGQLRDLKFFNPPPDPERYERRLADAKAQATAMASKFLRSGLVPADVATALVLSAVTVVDHYKCAAETAAWLRALADAMESESESDLAA